MRCPQVRCPLYAHLPCLSTWFLTQDENTIDKPLLLPIGGTCPLCRSQIKWGEVVHGLGHRLRQQKENEAKLEKSKKKIERRKIKSVQNQVTCVKSGMNPLNELNLNTQDHEFISEPLSEISLTTTTTTTTGNEKRNAIDLDEHHEKEVQVYDLTESDEISISLNPRRSPKRDRKGKNIVLARDSLPKPLNLTLSEDEEDDDDDGKNTQQCTLNAIANCSSDSDSLSNSDSDDSHDQDNESEFNAIPVSPLYQCKKPIHSSNRIALNSTSSHFICNSTSEKLISKKDSTEKLCASPSSSVLSPLSSWSISSISPQFQNQKKVRKKRIIRGLGETSYSPLN